MLLNRSVLRPTLATVVRVGPYEVTVAWVGTDVPPEHPVTFFLKPRLVRGVDPRLARAIDVNIGVEADRAWPIAFDTRPITPLGAMAEPKPSRLILSLGPHVSEKLLPDPDPLDNSPT